MKNFDKNFNLNQSETFCMFPFTGFRNLHGYFSPCPIFWRNETFFSDKNKIDGKAVDTFLNSEDMKALRKDMLNNTCSDRIKDVCRICKEHNSKSMSCLRNAANDFMAPFYDEVIKNLNDDYSLKNTDVLFSSFTNNNICNFKCRMCDKERSSSFLTNKDKKLNKFLNPNVLIRKEIYDTNFDIFRTSKFIYFGYSGEPFITPDHLYILNKLKRENLTDKTIIYHTNCSYMSTEILNTLEAFKQIRILASIDGTGDFHKIIRPSKIKWSTIEANIEKMISLKNLEFSIYASVGVLNAFHIVDMYNHFVGKNYIKANNFVINPIYNFLTAGNLQQEVKLELLEYYKKNIIDRITPNKEQLNFHKNTIVEEFMRFSEFIKIQPSQDLNLFKKEMLSLYSEHKRFFIKNYNYLLKAIL